MAVKVRQREHGVWYLYIDHQNRRKAISTRLSGPPDCCEWDRRGDGHPLPRCRAAAHKTAWRAAEQLNARLITGDLGLLRPKLKRVPTLAEYTEQWLRQRESLHIGSAQKYREVLRLRWFRALGSVPLSEITREHVKSELATLRDQGFAKTTRRLALDVLRACLNSAIDDRHLTVNPAARAGQFVGVGVSQEERRQEVEDSVFAPEELVILLTVAEAEFWEPFSHVVLLMARTGLREGEALALHVRDVDLRRGQLWVKRTWAIRGRKYGASRFNEPKGRRRRLVDMSDQLVSALGTYLAMREAHAILNGRTPSDWLFPCPERSRVQGYRKQGSERPVDSHERRSWWFQEGEPLDPRTFWSMWRRLLTRAGIRYRRPHVLRHSYATRLIAEALEHGQDGEAILHYVSKQLGHSSITITVDYYGHLVPSRRREIVNRLDDSRHQDATKGQQPDRNE